MNLKGTVFRLNQIVRGTCGCGDTDVLLYDTDRDPVLMCADCSRRRAKANPRIETCDECGGEHAWRDPLSGKNEFFCAKCHGKNGTVFQNRWAQAPRVLNFHPKAVCYAAGVTDCKGEIKPRSGFGGKLVCNKHAGKTSAGPEHHQ